MELARLKETYLASLKTTSEKTLHSYRQRLDALFSFFNCNQVVTVNQLSVELIHHYPETQINELATNTRYVYLEQAKHFLHYLADNNYSFVDLSEAIPLPKWERKQTSTFTPKQIDTMLKNIKEAEPYLSRTRAILGLHLLQKLRTGSIQNLTMLDLDFIRGELRMVKAKKMISMTQQTATLLKAWLKQRCRLTPHVDYVFIDKSGKQLALQVISRILKQA